MLDQLHLAIGVLFGQVLLCIDSGLDLFFFGTLALFKRIFLLLLCITKLPRALRLLLLVATVQRLQNTVFFVAQCLQLCFLLLVSQILIILNCLGTLFKLELYCAFFLLLSIFCCIGFLS